MEILPLASLILPFLLWPIEIYIGGGILWEELVKFGLAYYIDKQDYKLRTKYIFVVIIIGLFAFSESVLYLFNLNLQNRSLMDFILRLITSVPMHILTGIVVFWGINKGRYYLFIGIIAAFCIHILFNGYVDNLIY